MSRINVTIAYFSQEKQMFMQKIQQPPGTTIERAILASGILAHFPEINLEKQKVGIFGRLKPLDFFVADGDRIEIYHPLKVIGKQRIRQE